MSLGEIHWTWRADVRGIVDDILRQFPHVSANTYVNHPWPGWDGQSIDFWGPGGRGDPISQWDGLAIRKRLMEREGKPDIRHTIFRHTLWTSFGGVSEWTPADHSGRLRHLHVTYW